LGRKSAPLRRKQAAEAANRGADPFGYLVNCFKRERDPEKKRELAFQLLPYVKPRLKAVDVKAEVNHVISIEIGGEE
jgi:hypothetical protein